jgi:hypothetical protein
MNNEFVTYEQALDLKELGFDEPCFCLYENGKLGYSFSTSQGIITPISYRTNSKFVEHILTKEDCTAPLYQQAFRWFREKYKLEGLVERSKFSYKFTIYYYLSNSKGYVDYEIKKDTYEEAESACIDKLIEIAKQK